MSEILTVEKKQLTLLLPFLGELSLRSRTKLHKALKEAYGYSKLTLFSKTKKFQFDRWKSSYNAKTDGHLKVRYREHIGISPLSFYKVKPSVESSITEHNLLCDHSPCFHDFIILL